jgi:tetratricopeptide (TPR) repeat protein
MDASRRRKAIAALQRLVSELTGLQIGNDGKLAPADLLRSSDKIALPEIADVFTDQGSIPLDRTSAYLALHFSNADIALTAHSEAASIANQADTAFDSAQKAYIFAVNRLHITPQDVPAWISCIDDLATLGKVELQRGNRAAGEAHIQRALKYSVNLASRLTHDPSKVASLEVNQSFNYLFLSQGEEAVRHAQRCIELTDDSKTMAMARMNMAHGLLMLGKSNEAERIYVQDAKLMIGEHSFAYWVLDDFARFRRTGVYRTEMDHVTSLMRAAMEQSEQGGQP